MVRIGKKKHGEKTTPDKQDWIVFNSRRKLFKKNDEIDDKLFIAKVKHFRFSNFLIRLINLYFAGSTLFVKVEGYVSALIERCSAGNRSWTAVLQ
jgi:hypothetical protein